MINYSFIIPHRNVPLLLERCITSIPSRSDIEIIVIDDNSEDIDVLQSMDCLKKDNIHLIFLSKEESRGAGYARNRGIDIARGRWLVFADSDDTFDTMNLDKAMYECIKLDVDIVYFDVNCLDLETHTHLDNLNKSYKQYIYSRNKSEIGCRFYIRVPWGKFVKRELVERETIRFDEIPVANDLMFSLKIGCNAKSVLIKKYPIYNYMVHKNSITSNKSKDALFTHFMVNVNRNHYLEERKLYRYRNSLFSSIHMLLDKIKVPLGESLNLILKNTPMRFILRDLGVFLYDVFVYFLKY